MQVHVVTIFPQLVQAFMTAGIPRIAQEKGRLEVNSVDLRTFTTDVHRSVDDRPYGGGPGMVMLAGPVVDAVETIEREHGSCHRILLSPTGRRLDQAKLRELAAGERLLVFCGRYEGFDERVRQCIEWDEISLGDFVLSGGEVAAMALIDGVARLLPDVLGHPRSAESESFEDGRLEAPQYTRPRSYRGLEVPEVLLSGNHEQIARWREDQSLALTRARRPDLLTGGPPATERHED